MTPRQKNKPALLIFAAIIIFWLSNRMGGIYESTPGGIGDKIFAALDVEQLLNPPYGLCLSSTSLLWGLAGLAITALVAIWVIANKHKLMPGVEHGSARWGTPEDIKPFIDPKPENNIILTDTERLSMEGRMKVTADNDYNRNKNVIVFGGSGSRKTRGVIKPNLLQLNCNFVCTDIKLSLIHI